MVQRAVGRARSSPLDPPAERGVAAGVLGDEGAGGGGSRPRRHPVDRSRLLAVPAGAGRPWRWGSGGSASSIDLHRSAGVHRWKGGRRRDAHRAGVGDRSRRALLRGDLRGRGWPRPGHGRAAASSVGRGIWRCAGPAPAPCAGGEQAFGGAASLVGSRGWGRQGPEVPVAGCVCLFPMDRSTPALQGNAALFRGCAVLDRAARSCDGRCACGFRCFRSIFSGGAPTPGERNLSGCCATGRCPPCPKRRGRRGRRSRRIGVARCAMRDLGVASVVSMPVRS